MKVLSQEKIDNFPALARALQSRPKDIPQGDVKLTYNDPLVILGYTRQAEYNARWNWLERVSRGLIMNWQTGEIVARPFSKFFNWGQRGTTDAEMVCVTEKVDGSLGILYRDPSDPWDFRVATRGSFGGEQALWASLEIKKHDLVTLADQWTLLFEIVYPENRIVVDYGDKEGLVLLAVRNRFTGDYLPQWTVEDIALEYGFARTKVYHFGTVNDIAEDAAVLDMNQEGYVALFADGQRFKFKGARYLEAHRLMTMASFKNVLDWYERGELADIIAKFPLDHTKQIRNWRFAIHTRIRIVFHLTECAFHTAPPGCDGKTFAFWVKEHYPDLQQYLFRRRAGRKYRDLIIRDLRKRGASAL